MAKTQIYKGAQQGSPVSVIGTRQFGQTFGAIYDVPVGKYLIIQGLVIRYNSTGSNSESRLQIWIDAGGSEVATIKEIPASEFGADTKPIREDLNGLIIPSTGRIGLIGNSTQSNNGQVHVIFSGVLY